MKKLVAFLITIVVSFALVACKEPIDDTKVEPREITISGQPTNMEVGDEHQLTAKVSPDDANQEVVWSSSDPEVIEIDQTGKIKAVGAGLVEIVAVSKVNNRVQKKIQINVTEPIVFDDPEEIVFTSTRAEVAIGVFITLTVQVLPETARQEVLWSSSDDSIATVNAQGRVTGISEGIVIITATSVADPEITADYQVSVIEQDDTVEVQDPSDIIITGENQIVAGFSVYLLADVLPYGASLNVFWSSSDESVAVVDEGGKVTGISEGKAVITVVSARDTSIKKSMEITVLPYIDFPDVPNLQGYTVTILTDQGRIHEYYPFDPDYIPSDKYARMSAWEAVEARFNVKFEFGEYPDQAAWGSPRATWINENAAKNTHTADMVIMSTQFLHTLVSAGSIVDVTEFYETYGRGQLPPDLRQMGTYKQKLYTLPADLPGGIYVDQGLFYNVNLVEKYDLDSPAVLFNRGEWTYSRFLQYVEDANSVLAEDETVLSGSPTLYWMGMSHAAGVKLIDTNNLTVNFRNAYARQAAQTLRQAYLISWGDVNVDEHVTSFQEGKSIFQSGEFWFPKDSTRFAADMWGENTRFGYVPYPRPDNLTKSETRTNLGVGPAYMMLTGVANRPAYVTNEAIYRAWTEIVHGSIINIQNDPEFDIDVTMKRTAAFKLDEDASLEAIAFFKRDKLLYDPIIYGVVGYAQMIPNFDPVVTEGRDYFEAVDSVYSTFLTTLLELYG